MTSNQVNYWKLQEDKRHNIATENENVRHNKVGESQKSSDIDIARGNLAENARHNQVNEQLNRVQYEESVRHNRASEDASFIQANASSWRAATDAARAEADIALTNERTNTQKEITSSEHSKASQESTKVAKTVTDAAIAAKQLEYYEVPIIGGLIGTLSKIGG